MSGTAAPGGGVGVGGGAGGRCDGGGALLELRRLRKHFPIRRGVLRRTMGWIRAVDDVDLQVRVGETVGLVGESGCGKTTALRTIVRAVEPTGGEILFRTERGMQSITALERAALREVRQQIRVIFQDPQSSLNPRFKIGDVIAEPLKAYRMAASRSELDDLVADAMARVGLDRAYRDHYPYSLSGGQRQRVGIARALTTRPRLILADEPTSALDVSVQAQIINLLLELQRQMSLSMLFVTHDLSVVRHVSDRIAIMYLGEIVELGETDAVFKRPRHPYTEALFAAIPKPDPRRPGRRVIVQGDVPDAAQRPPGCPFHPRCRYAVAQCSAEKPSLDPRGSARHPVACHFPLPPSGVEGGGAGGAGGP